MANNPATRNVIQYKGAGSVQVYPNLPTMVNGTQDGINIAGAALSSPSAGTFSGINRVLDFLDRRLVLLADNSASNGIFERDQGGTGTWGKVGPAGWQPAIDDAVTGIHVIHPNSIPTAMHIVFHSFSFTVQVQTSVDGVTWPQAQVEVSGARPATTGQSLVYRNSVIWAHSHFTGAAGAGAITQFDLVTNVLTRYDVSAIMGPNQLAASYAMHVHDNVLFLFGWDAGASGLGTIAKLSTGVFVLVHTDTTQNSGPSFAASLGHSAMFTDLVTGDLIVIESGVRDSNDAPRARALRIQNATGSPTPSDISATVMDSGEGANKYLEGGGSANDDRRWAVFVDTQTAPDTPRTYLTTWVPGGFYETWEWKGVGAEMEAVALLAGISDDYAIPYDTVGGGHRLPREAAIEIGDASNPPVEVSGGKRYFFRVHGIGAIRVGTFRGTDDEGTPSTIIPIVAGSFSVVSGAPATTPLISGNTLTNITPDGGVALYQITLALGSVGVTEGEFALIIPGLV